MPLIKYYKQSGFKLDEMREYLGGASYFKIENGFRKKIDELISLQSELELKLRSVNDWYKLILEAEGIMECLSSWSEIYRKERNDFLRSRL